MRIAVWHNLPSGGGKRALFDHVAGLVQRGHHVEVWCPPGIDDEALPLSTLAPVHTVPLQRANGDTLADRLYLTLRTERELSWMDEHCQTCASQIDRGGFDILFGNSCRFYRTTSIGRFATIPSVLYLQEPFRWLYEAMPTLPWLARPPRDRMLPTVKDLRSTFADVKSIRNLRLQAREEVRNAVAFNRILVNSYFSRESILRAYGIDSEVCYLGIDTSRFAELGLPRENFVVGLGYITREKNLRLCIEALATVPPPRPGLKWIGNHSDSFWLNDARVLAAARGVEFEPLVGVPDSDVIKTLNRAMAMLYAPRLEPFGLAPLEANACGLPVIAVAEGGVRETMVHDITGLLVANDPASMGSAIQELRDDPLRARRLGASGRQAVLSNWGLDSAVDRLERALMRVAKTQTSTAQTPAPAALSAPVPPAPGG